MAKCALQGICVRCVYLERDVRHALHRLYRRVERSGFVDATAARRLHVVFPDNLASEFTAEELASLKKVLALDPRPQYHDNPTKVYGMEFACRDVRFRVEDDRLEVVEIG